MKTHELKITTKYFNKIVSGQKTCEIRKNDRGFEIGDLLHLTEINTSNSIELKITHIDNFEQKEDYVVLSFSKDPWCYDLSKAHRDNYLDQNIVFCGFQKEKILAYFSKDLNVWMQVGTGKICEPIAWMPIPEPKGGQDE